MLDNPFPVSFLCKLKNVRVYFLQNSKKITRKKVLKRREKAIFFEVIPGVLGCSINLKITQKFLFRRLVFTDYISICCDYGVIDVSACFYQKQPPECFMKNVLLEISQNSQENTCARLSFLINLQASGVFL